MDKEKAVEEGAESAPEADATAEDSTTVAEAETAEDAQADVSHPIVNLPHRALPLLRRLCLLPIDLHQPGCLPVSSISNVGKEAAMLLLIAFGRAWPLIATVECRNAGQYL